MYVCTQHMSLFALHYKKAKHGLGFSFRSVFDGCPPLRCAFLPAGCVCAPPVSNSDAGARLRWGGGSPAVLKGHRRPRPRPRRQPLAVDADWTWACAAGWRVCLRLCRCDQSFSSIYKCLRHQRSAPPCLRDARRYLPHRLTVGGLFWFTEWFDLIPPSSTHTFLVGSIEGRAEADGPWIRSNLRGGFISFLSSVEVFVEDLKI